MIPTIILRKKIEITQEEFDFDADCVLAISDIQSPFSVNWMFDPKNKKLKLFSIPHSKECFVTYLSLKDEVVFLRKDKLKKLNKLSEQDI